MKKIILLDALGNGNKRLGHRHLGPETSSQYALDLNNKGIKVKDAYNAVKWAKGAGLKVLGLFIFLNIAERLQKLVI